MEPVDSKPWQRPAQQTIEYHASRLSVLLSLLPLFGIVIAGCGVQYVLNGEISDGMDWVVGGVAMFLLIAALFAPLFNSLQFTPEHFMLREMTRRKQIAWSDIEPDSFGSVVRTFYFIPLFTSIGFRVKPDSPHHTGLAQMAGVVSGLHVYFVNMYPLRSNKLIETLQKYHARYSSEHDAFADSEG